MKNTKICTKIAVIYDIRASTVKQMLEKAVENLETGNEGKQNQKHKQKNTVKLVLQQKQIDNVKSNLIHLVILVF